MHPYYYQQYYAAQMAGAGYVPVVAQGGQQQMAAAQGMYNWPMYTYQGGVPMVQTANGAVPAAYYFPYTHPAYAQYQQQYMQQASQQATATTETGSSAPEEPAAVESEPQQETSSTPELPPLASRTTTRVSDISRTVTMSRTESLTGMEPLPLLRTQSKGFARDKSKWRLSRSGSKPSLAIDGTGGDADEDWDLPSSPLMGRKGSLSVSPRHCGSAFLPDEEVAKPATIESVNKKSFSGSEIHLVDAIRMFSKELEMPIDSKFADRLEQLENAATIPMAVVSSQSSSSADAIGLQNPLNSKICYLNSVVQVLLPIAPLMQVLSLSLSHGSAGAWTAAIARAMRLFFHPPMGTNASLLAVTGMEAIIRELGGIGTQQDVAEALSIILDRLHEEWKHVLRKQLWSDVQAKPSHGLEEDSIVYKLFRGVRVADKQLEIFTQIHLAPPAGGPSSLCELLAQTIKGELHYLPPVLCVELSRHLSENQLTASQTSVSFSGSMQIPLSCCTRGVNGDRKYQLVGAVVRSGVYANSGHFWAAQRRGDKWLWINDTEVSDCNVTAEEQADASEGLISKKLDAASNWCVLVYADATAKVAIHPYN